MTGKSKNWLYPAKPEPGQWGPWLAKRLIVVVSLVVILILGGIAYKNKLIFHPTTDIYKTPESFALNYKESWEELKSGDKVKVWRVQSPYEDSGAKTAIVLQGNSGNVSLMSSRMALLAYLGFNVLSADYPGYGQNEGAPSEEGTYETAEMLWNLAIESGAKPEEIVIYGFSVGGGAAAYLAEAHQPAALVLDSTFTRLRDVPTVRFPVLAYYLKTILGDAYDTKERLKNIKSPLLVIHSPDDDLVPYKLGVELYDTYQNNYKDMATGTGEHLGFILNLPLYREKIANLLLEAGLLDSIEPRPGSWPIVPTPRPAVTQDQ